MNDYMDEYERNRKWLEDHDWDRHLWPEEATFIEAFDKGRAYEHANAFGAIRRAAEVARELDDCNTNDCGFGHVPHDIAAYWIRKAIRAAIGSDNESVIGGD